MNNIARKEIASRRRGPSVYKPFRVVTTIPTHTSNVQYTIVTEADDLSRIWDILMRDRGIYCAQLLMEPSTNSPRKVIKAAPLILGVNAIASISHLHFELDMESLEAALEGFNWGVSIERGHSAFVA